ncbi:MAG: DUF4364 family protein [Clostridiales bacterium]|nr:DUF4364 family protein [Clostridiales bacterium]
MNSFETENNTFDAGVLPGGLRNDIQIKILLCFLIENVDGILTLTGLIETLSDSGIANYFAVAQALSDLREDGNITVNENQEASITVKGRTALSELNSIIPVTIKEAALAKANTTAEKYKNEKSTRVTTEPYGQGYMVKCKINAGQTTLMELNIFAADSEQALQIKERFIENPTKIYKNILDSVDD